MFMGIWPSMWAQNISSNFRYSCCTSNATRFFFNIFLKCLSSLRTEKSYFYAGTAEGLQDSARLNNTLVGRVAHLSHLHDMTLQHQANSEIFPFWISFQCFSTMGCHRSASYNGRQVFLSKQTIAASPRRKRVSKLAAAAPPALWDSWPTDRSTVWSKMRRAAAKSWFWMPETFRWGGMDGTAGGGVAAFCER